MITGALRPPVPVIETVAVAVGPLERTAALEAAGIETFDPDLIASLERGRLLRSMAGAQRSRLEIYHDRIREVIVEKIPVQAQRERHRRGEDRSADNATAP